MADPKFKNSENTPGAFYVDDTCIDCDMCRSNVPQFFRQMDAEPYSVVWQQPVTPEEIALAMEALQGCPTESIGNDGA
ncbi:MAG TPA: ferredoxin [Chthoniobacterales bacterium]|jgi:ferredoxin